MNRSDIPRCSIDACGAPVKARGLCEAHVNPVSMDELADAVAEKAMRCTTVLNDRLFAIRDAMNGQPGAASYEQDRTSGHTTRMFCELHQRDRCNCGAMTSYPAVSDPTGEAALRLDMAKQDHRLIERNLVAAHRAISNVESILGRWGTRTPTSKEREATAPTAAPGCVSCARTEVAPGVPRFEYRSRGDLCRWCDDVKRQTGAVPTTAALADHHRGKRVPRKAS